MGEDVTAAATSIYQSTLNPIFSIGGRQQFGDKTIDASVGHFTIWNAELSAGSIASIQGGTDPSTIETGSISRNWRFDVNDANLLIDTIAAVTLTNNNSAVFDADNPPVTAPGTVFEQIGQINLSITVSGTQSLIPGGTITTQNGATSMVVSVNGTQTHITPGLFVQNGSTSMTIGVNGTQAHIMSGPSENSSINMTIGKNSTELKFESDDQFNNLNSIKPFEQKLFGSHTASAFDSGTNESDWVKMFTSAEIPTGATVAINENNYLIGSIRYPAGTFSNYLDWDSEYMHGLNGVYKEVFRKENMYNDTLSSIITYGQPKKFTLSSFVDYAKNYLPDSQIHIALNVYTQSLSEIKSAIDKFKTSLSDDSRVIYWELGNELGGISYDYMDLASDAASPGSFPNLTGDDLIKAKENYPEEIVNPNVHARKLFHICEYIRANYSSDKIGLVSSTLSNMITPAGGPAFTPLAIERAVNWAQAHQRHIPTDKYDALIVHPYVSTTGDDLDILAADSIPTSGKELDASFTDQEDKIWRFHITIAQEFLNLTVNDMRSLWPDNKELWLTEWGMLTAAFNVLVVPSGTSDTPVLNKLPDAAADFTDVEVGDRVLNVTTQNQAAVTVKDSTTLLTLDADIFQTAGHTYEISTKNQPASFASPDQYILRACYIASFAISVAEQNIKWKNRMEITTTLYHLLLRGQGASSGFFFSGYMNANGCAFSLLRNAVDGMTHMAIPALNDIAVQFDCQNPYDQKKLHPVRAIFFTDGTIERMFIVNISPTARTVEIPFSTSTGRKLEAASSPANPFEQIADSTYETYTDLAASVVGTTSMTIAPFSIHTLEKTTGSVSLDNVVLNVT
ncbi:MAG: hypothetical protein KJO69_11315 [Gammaproteobacteria bacterium]|nr:hypothetical protein [Gammaproteobacteria bacterium]